MESPVHMLADVNSEAACKVISSALSSGNDDAVLKSLACSLMVKKALCSASGQPNDELVSPYRLNKMANSGTVRLSMQEFFAILDRLGLRADVKVKHEPKAEFVGPVHPAA